MRSESLWTKTLVGLILSFLLSMGLMVNIGFAFPIPRDIFLMFAVLVGFSSWAGILSWFFCVQSIKKPTMICLVIFSVSAAVNTWFYMGSTT